MLVTDEIEEALLTHYVDDLGKFLLNLRKLNVILSVAQ